MAWLRTRTSVMYREENVTFHAIAESGLVSHSHSLDWPFLYAHALLKIFIMWEKNYLRTSAHSKRPLKVIIASGCKPMELEMTFKPDRTLKPESATIQTQVEERPSQREDLSQINTFMFCFTFPQGPRGRLPSKQAFLTHHNSSKSPLQELYLKEQKEQNNKQKTTTTNNWICAVSPNSPVDSGLCNLAIWAHTWIPRHTI